MWFPLWWQPSFATISNTLTQFWPHFLFHPWVVNHFDDVLHWRLNQLSIWIAAAVAVPFSIALIVGASISMPHAHDLATNFVIWPWLWGKEPQSHGQRISSSWTKFPALFGTCNFSHLCVCIGELLQTPFCNSQPSPRINVQLRSRPSVPLIGQARN